MGKCIEYHTCPARKLRNESLRKSRDIHDYGFYLTAIEVVAQLNKEHCHGNPEECTYRQLRETETEIPVLLE